MELNNPQDPFAVVVIKDDSSGNGITVVGHVLRAVSRTVSFFLGKDGSVGFCEVTQPRRWIWPGNPMRVPVLWTPGLHRKTQEPFAVAKNITDRC